MIRQVGITVAALGFMLNQAVSYGKHPGYGVSKVEISAKPKTIRIGEPLIIRLALEWEKPLIPADTEMVLQGLEQSAYVNVNYEAEPNLVERYPILPTAADTQAEDGSTYSVHFLVFYDYGLNKLIFGKQGIYTVYVKAWRNVSNSLKIEVGPPSALEARAISILSNANDYHFLILGTHDYRAKRPERIAHLREVAERCEGTVLANWSAARIGLEYFYEFHRQNPSFEKFKAARREMGIEDPNFTLARKYLAQGRELIDELPIREKVLLYLSKTEWIMDDYERVDSLLDELESKYPSGRYGKQVPKARIELQAIKKREIEESRKAELEHGDSQADAVPEAGDKPLPMVPIFAGAAVAVVVGAILLLKKKRT
ncbi:MAG: hypothetical protein ACYS8I_13290 [Planctomycetota bacterium]|jgi:hypothetical protein